MLIGEMIQRVQSKFSSGVQNDAVWLSNRYVYNILLSARNTLLDQSAKKKQFISQWNYQTLPCVEMIEVPLVECPGMPSLPMTIMRTKEQLPRPLTNLSKHMIEAVFTVDGQNKVDVGDFSSTLYQKGNKYTSLRPIFFIKDKYGWLKGAKFAALLIGPGLFEDPLKVATFPSYCYSTAPSCQSYLDYEFPADDDMSKTLIELATQEIVQGFGQEAKKKVQEKQNEE